MQTLTKVDSGLECERYMLCSFLRQREAELIGSAKHDCGIANAMTLHTEALLHDFTDVFISSLGQNDWKALEGWITHSSEAQEQSPLLKELLISSMNVIIRLCEQLLPPLSPLLHSIQLKTLSLQAQIECILPPTHHIHSSNVHDPQGVTIDVLLLALDSRDRATAEHSRAVSSWSRRLAVRMGLPQPLIEQVTRGGLVHDLGKTLTPLEILNAPRKLTDEEWVIMQDHVIAGWQMLAEFPVLEEFLPIVRNHHERFDGGGYPDQLHGTDITLATRIVSVADAFNAMIGRRPYRTPLSPLHAIHELRRFRGTQFDPDVTDAMTELVRAKSQV